MVLIGLPEEIATFIVPSNRPHANEVTSPKTTLSAPERIIISISRCIRVIANPIRLSLDPTQPSTCPNPHTKEHLPRHLPHPVEPQPG